MKKKIIIVLIFIFALAVVIGSIFLIKNIKEKRIEREKIETITLKYSNYKGGDKLSCDDELCNYLNSTIVMHEKINSLQKIDLSINKIKNLKDTINEINNLKSELGELKFENVDNYLSNMDDIQKSAFMSIYNESIITISRNEDKEILDEYLSNIDNNLNILNYFKDNQNKYKIENSKLVYNDDSFKKYVENLNLGIPLEKQEETKSVTQSEVKPSGKKIPILMYHAVDDDIWGEKSLFVYTDNFKKQMEYLHEQGFTTLFLSEISNAHNVSKPVIITFDDGYKDMYDIAYPIMKDLNIKSNMYIITGWLDGITYMSLDMVKELSNSGLVEIGSHTISHVFLASKSYTEQERQLKESKTYLENLLGKEINTIAYPYGSYNNDTISIAKKYYKYAVTTQSGANYTGSFSSSPLTLKRYNIMNTTGLETFKNLVN